MMKRNSNGEAPQLDLSAFVDSTATIRGKVITRAKAFIGPYAVIHANATEFKTGSLA